MTRGAGKIEVDVFMPYPNRSSSDIGKDLLTVVDVGIFTFEEFKDFGVIVTQPVVCEFSGVCNHFLDGV